VKRLADALAAARGRQRLAFLPCVTAGDPDRDTSLAVALMLSGEGADVLGIEAPFSDAFRESAALHGARRRALDAGMNLGRALELAQELRQRSSTPLVLFTCFHPILRLGLSTFAEQAARAGVDGVLVLDLPPEEGGDYRRALSATGLDPIFTLSTASSRDRARLVAEVTGGFIYYAVAPGGRGEADRVPAGLRQEVARIRLASSLPVAVDAGCISRRAVEQLSGAADAVVIRSSLAQWMEKARGTDEAVETVRDGLRELMGTDLG
jgi:tryptophan synthase alpha chain